MGMYLKFFFKILLLYHKNTFTNEFFSAKIQPTILLLSNSKTNYFNSNLVFSLRLEFTLLLQWVFIIIFSFNTSIKVTYTTP